jgi:outer membrane protein OmpA-like peptidoglycan-associated protein
VRLQREAGNRATAAALAAGRVGGGWRGDVAVQRFEGPEHQQIGDAAGRPIDLGHGVVLSWGQVVAIAGDEYGSIDDLMADAATADGRARIRAALEHDRVPGAVAATLPATSTKTASGKTAKEEQDARYQDLVVANVSHFAAGGTAIATWTQHHQDALAKAVEAGLAGDPNQLEIAYATEAFGQHFLTDSFSGGHVRTPRAAILDWYSTVFGPKVVPHLIEDLRGKLTATFAKQISASLPPAMSGLTSVVLQAASSLTTEVIETILGGGGMAELGQRFGVYIAGAVSGTFHDMEGERGVWVSSKAHPTPWLAFGDARLHDSPDSEAEAAHAVVAAKAQVDQANAIGARFRKTVAAPFAPPHTMYFGFNQSTLDGPATADCQAAADYLRVHPDATLDIVGHTDPIGSDAANDALGMRRAETVAAAVTATGVDQARVTFSSRGEHDLATTKPNDYRLDRRVELHWGTTPTSTPTREHEEAFAALLAEIPPSYDPVLDRVPNEVPAINIPLEDWHWGSIPRPVQGELDKWINVHIGPLIPGLLARPELTPKTVSIPSGPTITVDPAAAVKHETDDLLKDPVAYLNGAFGQPAGP